MINISFENKRYQIPEGTTVRGFLESINRFSRSVIFARLNDRAVDLSHEIREDGAGLTTFDIHAPESLEVLRHSAAHLMAQAVKELFPDAKLTIGPAIEDGFYYDFSVSPPFTPQDIEKIEQRMKELSKKDVPIQRMELSKAQAEELFGQRREAYKLEILKGIDGSISAYRQGDFIDLCSGPHVPSTGYIKAFKLLSTAGAYWRGDEHNEMLRRIYGTAFPDRESLKAHLERIEEAKKRDHRKLGRELGLFSIEEEIGAGLVLWHPRGATLRSIIETYWKDLHAASGYEFVYTPHIAKLSLWETSGHLGFYRENMFPSMELESIDYQLKPMNCPFHIAIYKTTTRSYRDLPLRWAELGTVYRFERSGVMHGLMRVRGFTQDDAHVFVTPEQLRDEVVKILDLALEYLRTFGFENFTIYLSTRPEKYVGSLENWARAESALKSALEAKGLSYLVDPGEGVFYGPKIDVKIKDVLGREWQCTTVQIDFNEPERFDVGYIGEDNQKHRTVMLHRAIMGSLERFIGVLIEHYGGAFPFWLSPVQAKVITINTRNVAYAKEIMLKLRHARIRAEEDFREETLSYKVREATVQKIPYLLIVGDKEQGSGTVNVRRFKETAQRPYAVEELLNMLYKSNTERTST
ncbi:MAG: threonine--tRNA ligase [Deltaproteobacteria bacterium]|nr:threonine--tRNA ligase [Deltaproteobacteria bacterium]